MVWSGTTPGVAPVELVSHKPVLRRVRRFDPVALRQNVRAVGETGYYSRVILGWAAVSVPAAIAIGVLMGAADIDQYAQPGATASLQECFLQAFLPSAVSIGALVLAVAAVSAVPLRVLHGAYRRWQLQRSFSELPPDRVTRALEPLLDDRVRETRQLARRLLRELQRPPSELAPAPAAGGRGTELLVTDD